MCIRDRNGAHCAPGDIARRVALVRAAEKVVGRPVGVLLDCLLYTSDAADERSSVDLGGRRIIKKKYRHISYHDLCTQSIYRGT